jgi:uncharacterized protein (TIGR02246 family)
MDHDELAARVRRLEDLEAIRRLKVDYCTACDDDHDGAAVAALFVPDGRWSSSMGADCRGQAAIRAYFDAIRAAGRMVHSAHQVTNPAIDLDGDEAAATWLLQMRYTTVGGARYRIVGSYRDRYVRIDGRWRFASLHAEVRDHVRLEVEPLG